MGLSFNPSEVECRFTEEQEAELRMWSQTHEILKNHRVYPLPEDKEPDALSVQARLNDFGEAGEKDLGHPDRREPVTALPGGYEDAPEDVKAEIEPLNVAELKAELDQLQVEYASDAKKDDLRNLLAVEWSKV